MANGLSHGTGPSELSDVVEVFVVDAHSYVRLMLVELIERAEGLAVVGSSGSAQRAFADIVRLHPHVAVLDGALGDLRALDLCRDLHSAAPAVASVIVTAGVGDAWGSEEAAAAGAAALLLKQLIDFPLVEVIGRVAAGERLVGQPDWRSPSSVIPSLDRLGPAKR